MFLTQAKVEIDGKILILSNSSNVNVFPHGCAKVSNAYLNREEALIHNDYEKIDYEY